MYALRGDRDWRRSPQLTGSRQVSPLAVQAYKLLEQGDANIAKLTHELGREVTEAAVLRAITELWQQLRIIPVVSAPGQPAQWQLLRQRFQKAIAEGASTSQVTAISVLASIYLQAVIAASMEEVEIFLAPLTARSKVREVLRGLVATRQVHTLSLGHAPHYYVAGTLPEFSEPATLYTSSSMSASAYFLNSYEHEEETPEPTAEQPIPETTQTPDAPRIATESHALRTPAQRKPAGAGKPAAARPHFSRPAASSRDRKPAQTASTGRAVRRTTADARSSGARPLNSAHAASSSTNGSRSNGNGSRPASGSNGARTANSTAPAWGQRNGRSNNSKSTVSRTGSSQRKDSRTDTRPAARNSRKPALTAGTKAGNSKRFGFTARPSEGTKKRG